MLFVINQLETRQFASIPMQLSQIRNVSVMDNHSLYVLRLSKISKKHLEDDILIYTVLFILHLLFTLPSFND